ncbi:MAG: N-acetyl-gamma-glutamyl-phosphate reductase [Gammaproteobacteria bacterium]|nr:N-acetyl-gamma-glutamyl-phosphate reductase [Gammaproteobacteria bacterium]
MNNKQYSLGIVGVRGYVGKELLALISAHPQIKTEWLSSRQLEGQLASAALERADDKDLDFIIESLSPEQVADKNTDIIVLALPNGLAESFVQAIEKNKGQTKIIIDLSADYRFADSEGNNSWLYSVPELDEKALVEAKNGELIKISNPGCYATAMQLALAPIIQLLEGPAHCFGVSGYSGAGTTPSPNNDPENLKDNLIGYKLLEHLHEKEVGERLKAPVSFSPHVAAFFRGINMTVQVELTEPQTDIALLNRYNDFYQHHPLVNCQPTIPVIKQVTNTANCLIGGFAVSSDGKRATIISCLDNLLKGAASQALQNINIALELEPLMAVQPLATGEQE